MNSVTAWNIKSVLRYKRSQKMATSGTKYDTFGGSDCTISKTFILFYLLVWWNVQVWQLWPESMDGWTAGRFFIFLLSRMWWEVQNKRYFFTTCTLPSPKCELSFWYVKNTLGILWGILWRMLCEYVGSTLGILWKYVLWEHFGRTLGALWEYFGNTLGVLWEHFGNTLGVLWEYFGSTLGVLWEYFGSTSGVIWE